MIIHRLQTAMLIPMKIDHVFEFFCDVHNLERITPPELNFHVLPPAPLSICEGTVIHFRLRLLSIPFRWETLISVWDPPHRFVDEQLKGPYKMWVHNHWFSEHGDGTQILDHVAYALPFGLLGESAYPLVHLQLRRIFRYRQETVRTILSTRAASEEA